MGVGTEDYARFLYVRAADCCRKRDQPKSLSANVAAPCHPMVLYYVESRTIVCFIGDVGCKAIVRAHEAWPLQLLSHTPLRSSAAAVNALARVS
jgi:hypothetical protein